MAKAMENMTISRDGDIVTIRIDMTKDLGLSSKEKTRLVSCSRGAVDLPGDEQVRMTLTAWKPLATPREPSGYTVPLKS